MLRSLTVISLGLILCSAPLRSQRLAVDDDPVRAQRIDAGHWRIVCENPEPNLLRLPDEGVSYTRVGMPGYLYSRLPGQPELPLRRLAFGIPSGGSLEIRISGVQEDHLPGNMIPWQTAAHAREPLAWADAELPTQRDGLTEQAVVLHPVRMEPSGGWHWAKRLTVDVFIHGVEGSTGATHSVPGIWLNAEDAKNWRAAMPLLSKPALSFAETSDRMRIRTPEEGMYRITYEALSQGGFVASGVDPATFHMRHDGAELPMFVQDGNDHSFDPGDYVEFFAARQSGADGEWFDEWSDRNTFMLSWGGDAGVRFGVENVDPAAHPEAIDPEPDILPQRLHLEEDHEYHRGDFEYDDMLHSGKVYGEAWMWGYLLKRDSITMAFALPDPAAEVSRLVFRFKCTSRDSSLLRISINGQAVAEQGVGSYRIRTDSVTIPSGLLRSGQNTITFMNVGIVQCPPEDPACSIERLYVDWAELTWPSELSAVRSTLVFDPSLSRPGGVRLLYDAPFDAQEIRGVNLDGGSMLEGLRVRNDGGHWRATAALRDDQHYVLYTPGEVHTGAEVQRVTFRDFASASNGADYLVITHGNFLQQAQRLASYRRSHDGYRTVIADVQDIYDEFNEGRKDPAAIREFLKTAYEHWQKPAPKFVVIIGDASWDPKKLHASSTKEDFVPAFGNPVSDNWYVSFSDKDDAYPSMAIGRIPAEQPAHADDVIDKIFEYEAQKPKEWDNRILFSVGGKDPFEQDVQLKPIAETLIRHWIDPYCLDPRRIYKKTLDIVSYDDLDTLIYEVNTGISWFFFTGHGGTRVIDVGIERPDIFDNAGKYIFFVTMSCNTAHFGEPFETGLNERFIMSPRNGAIVSLGTSGLGVIGYDYILSEGMFSALLEKGARTYGEIMLLGKQSLLDGYGNGNVTAYNTAQQVTLLGDPATRVPVASTPELAVQAENVTLDPPILTENRPTRISTMVQNYGLCLTDSVTVLFRVEHSGSILNEQRRRIPAFLLHEALEWEYDFAEVSGMIELRIVVDADNEIAELEEDNNSVLLRLSVQPGGLTPIFPLADAQMPYGGAPIGVVLANPATIADGVDEAELQFSQDPSFKSAPVSITAELGPVFTHAEWTPASEGLWYWRARLSGTEQWSVTRATYVSGGSGTGETWLQLEPPQLKANSMRNLVEGAGGVRLGSRRLPLEVASGGYNGPFREAILRVDGVNVSTNRRGFNVAVVEPLLGTLIDTVNFDTYRGRAVAGEMAAYLDALDEDKIVMIAVLDDANGYPPVSPEGTNISPELKAALKRFGATQIDSVGFRDSYVMIGSKALPAGTVEEHLVLGVVFRDDTLTVLAKEGELRSAFVGPANSWTELRWQGTAGSAGSAVTLRAIGTGADGRDSVLTERVNAAPGDALQLGAVTQPFLRFAAVLQDSSGTQSPVLQSWSAGFTSRFPEVGVTGRVVTLSADSLLEGEPLRVDVDVYNAGRSEAAQYSVGLRVASGESVPQVQVIPALAAGEDSHRSLSFEMPTAGLRGTVTVEVQLDAGGSHTEYHRGNNTFGRRFTAGRDRQAPQIEVLFDGAAIADDDYVSPNPRIDIRLRDSSPLPVKDTSSLQLFLDGRRVWLLSDPQVQYTAGSGDEKVAVEFRPSLQPGFHYLSVSGKDASGNPADTIPYQVYFSVTAENKVDQIIPYPSPTSGPMDFTFRLLGSTVPEEARIKIYTVAGRMIHEIEIPPEQLHIGFNRITWDGRDRDGDQPANGVYFYKLVLRRGDRQEEFVNRFAVLR